tara:strand:+ start:144 stop:716 length:573 start_codon:yes stop_codon:yes gene_type:complete
MSSNLGGIREIMWCSFKMKKEDLKNTDKESFLSQIENTFQEQSLRLFSTNINHEITLEENAIEVVFNKPEKEKYKLELDSNEMKVDIYEILEKSSVFIDDQVDSSKLKLEIDSKQDPNIYIYGHEVFDDTEYKFLKGAEQLDIYLESESSGSVSRKLCYIKSTDQKFIIDLTDEEHIDDVFSELKKYLAK